MFAAPFGASTCSITNFFLVLQSRRSLSLFTRPSIAWWKTLISGVGLVCSSYLVADIDEKKAEKEGRQVKQRKRGEMGRGAVVIV